VGGDAEQALLEVADTGAGIAPDFLPHAFDLFRQEDASSRRAHGGLGLGLGIVRDIVQLHGGQVEAHSEGTGRGATFRARLPAYRGEVTGAPADASPSIPRLDGIRVLVVEDHEDSRSLITVALSALGATVMEAREAEQAYEMLVKERPDVVVADIGMPGRTGYELMEQVRTLPREVGGLVPAIALTAYARTEDRVRALVAGYQVHMPKPVQPAALASAIAGLVTRPPRT
jgi:CheY-like chemotaxis protein